MAVTTPPTTTAVIRGAEPGTRQGTALVIALIVACAYAAFAHGAVDTPEEARLQVGIAALTLAAAVWWLGSGSVRLAAPPAAWWGVGLLAAFAVWSGITLLWSVAPDRTWLEVNRALAYTLVVVLAIAAGASSRAAIERVATGLLVVIGVVGLYALGGKVLPGVNLHPFFDFNQTAAVARLRAPLQYWNALALVCVFGMPIAIRIAVDGARSPAVRLAALGMLYVLGIDLGMTYSRGGVLAFVAAVVTITALGGARLRGLLTLALAAAAVAGPLAFAFTKDGLTKNGAPLGVRISDGRTLGALILLGGAVLLAAGWLLIQVEPRVRWNQRRSDLIWRGLAALVATAALVGLFMLATSDRGLRGSVSHAAHSFTGAKQDKVSDPVRLVSTNSGNRWVWWKEAAGAFSDKPLGGWGAGSFPVVHKLYRTNQLPVAQPHSVPLQFLSETGLVGALLALGGLALLFAAALGRISAMQAGREHDLAVALFAGAVGWLLHGFYDWDWDIPGVTLPALVFLGLLAARPGREGVLARRAALFGEPEREGQGLRVAALGAAAALLCAFVTSAVLPALSQSQTSAAAAASGGKTTAAQLQAAAAKADLAAKLDPLAVEPLFVSSAIALGRGRVLDARDFLLEAVRRQPDNPDAWSRLAGIAFQLVDRPGFERAATKLLELDPANGTAKALALRAQAFLAPPALSATATGTPLPAGTGTPPPPGTVIP